MSFKQYLQAKAIHTGTEWRLSFIVTTSGSAPFPASGKFRAQFRDKPDGKVLADLTTANGGIVRINDNSINLVLPSSASKAWHVDSVVTDIVRTDLTNPVHLGFTLKIPVRRSITQV
ncbi:hypothetical protein FHV99_004694 [Ochrobactrum sp. P20RRXII]|nr:hypothetical protein [Ochrobactrum sp. P20RRXII]NIH77442.1 hypothetical protein [Ochrobactrum sp. P20RRXII]